MPCELWLDPTIQNDDGIDIFFGPDEGNAMGGYAMDVPSSAFCITGTHTYDDTPARLSSTIAHEMGHCLGLLHTHHGTTPTPGFNCTTFSFYDIDPGSCCELVNTNDTTCGDYVGDTNADCRNWTPSGTLPNPCGDLTMSYGTSNQTCSQETNTGLIVDANGNVYEPPVEVIMNHGLGIVHQCAANFTEGQVERMYQIISTEPVLQACLIEAVPSIIDTDDVWITQPAMYAYNDITINSGVTLTISTTLQMAEGKAIIVEPGGVLEVIDGTITAPCDQTWKGIYLGGNPLISQSSISAYDQGRIYLTNATIEHAHDAVTTRQTESGWLQYDANGNIAGGTTGGIIKAHNTTFRNNKRAIEYLKYENVFNGIEMDNAGEFNLCTFTIDDEYRFNYNQTSDAGLKPFVSMWDVSGVAFRGCVFEDAREIIGSDFANNERPSGKIGIKSILADYSIDWYCEPPTTLPAPSCTVGTPSSFIELDYGIRSYGSDEQVFNVAVKNSNFECWHGIYLNASYDSEIHANTFTVKQNLPEPAPPVPSYGIYLDASEAYSVENNNLESEFPFGSPFAGDEHAGVVVRNAHPNPTVIYRNNFNGFSVATEAIGYNRQSGDETNPAVQGLEIRCNDFSNDRIDIFVFDDINSSTPTGTEIGIKPIQDLPGNLFSLPDINLNPNYVSNIYNQNQANIDQLTYIHHDDATTSRVIPGCPEPQMPCVGFWGNLEIQPTTVPLETSTCPDNLAENGISGLTLGELESIKDVKGELYQQIKTDLETLVDGGETEELKEDVENATFQSAYSVYQDVLQKQSFVSDTVLKQISKKETGFTTGMIRDMLASSPQAAKSEKIQQNLDERTVQLPEYMRQQINMGMTITSSKEQMELEADRQKRERDRAIHQAVRLLAADTIDRSEEMIDFLSGTNEIGFDYRVAAIRDARGETALADDMLDAIAQRDLSQKEADDHTDYIGLRSLLQSWKQTGKNLAALDATDMLILEEYAEKHNITAGKARTLLALNGRFYEEPVYFPEPAVEERRIQENEPETLEISENVLLVYPNPAREYFTVEYAIAKDIENLYLVIINTLGDEVYKRPLSYTQDQIIVPTEQLPTGQYFCNIQVNDVVLKTDKFVLAK